MYKIELKLILAFLILFFFIQKISAEVNLQKSNFEILDLNTSQKNYDIFFNSTDYKQLKKWRKAKLTLNNITHSAKFRSRGFEENHYRNANRTIKIKVKKNKFNQFQKKKWDTYNLNAINTDIFLADPIAYSIMDSYGFIGLNSEFGSAKINGNYNGIKIIYENLDDNIFWKRNIKLATMYREAENGYLGNFREWDKEKYTDWEFQSLKRQGDMLDWMSFLYGNQKTNDNFYKYLEKNLDIEYYLKWLALSTITNGYKHLLDHNFVFYNNLEIQKFRPITYDPAGLNIYEINNPIQFFGNEFTKKILMNENYLNKILNNINKILTKTPYKQIYTNATDHQFLKFEKAVLDMQKIVENFKLYDDFEESRVRKTFKKFLLDPNCKVSSDKKSFNLMLATNKNYCVIKNLKKMNKKFFEERKNSLLNQMNKIEYFFYTNELSKNVSNSKILNKEILNFSVKLKSLSNQKINKVIFKINKNNLAVDKLTLLLCEKKIPDLKKIIKKNCIIGKIEDKKIEFKFANKNSLFKAKLNLSQTGNDKIYSYSAYDNISLQPAKVEKKFSIYFEKKHNSKNDLSIILEKVELENSVTKKITNIVNAHRKIKGEDKEKILPLNSKIDYKKLLKKYIFNIQNKKIYYNAKSKFDNFISFESFFSKSGYNIDQSFFKKVSLPENKKIIWGPNKNIYIKHNTILPINSTLIILPGTKVIFEKNKSIIFKGILIAKGSEKNPIYFGTKNQKTFFGSLIFNHESMSGSKINHVIIERGSDVLWNNRFYTGALNIYNTSVNINNSFFKNNIGDDALNLKYSKSIISNSYFLYNKFDGLDADFSNVKILNCVFSKNGNDAIDLGTSIADIKNNNIKFSGDKGLSIGEESQVSAENNTIIKNNIGIANKDESFLKIKDNLIISNKIQITNYVKKKKFGYPKMEELR